ncbi:hypothetical protein ACLMJK_001929 [Lecanora helva]
MQLSYANYSYILLALLPFLISTAIASAIPHNTPHDLLVPAITSHNLPPPPPSPPSPPHLPARGLPAHLTRIGGLPTGWTGLFLSFRTTRPTIPIPSIFIRFFRLAASAASQDPYLGRSFQRFEIGALVLEFFAVEDGGYVTREFMQAASLWLMERAQRGWVGLFEAWVMDRDDGEVVYVRCATIWDLPMKVDNSPWGN